MPKIDKLKLLFDTLNLRLPSTYPKPHLVVHPTLKKLEKSFRRGNDFSKNIIPEAFCDINNNTVHVANILRKKNEFEILWFYLHEIGHLYAVKRYGIYNVRWKDARESESYADNFANRWVRRLQQERVPP